MRIFGIMTNEVKINYLVYNGIDKKTAIKLIEIQKPKAGPIVYSIKKNMLHKLNVKIIDQIYFLQLCHMEYINNRCCANLFRLEEAIRNVKYNLYWYTLLLDSLPFYDSSCETEIIADKFYRAENNRLIEYIKYVLLKYSL